MVTANPSFMDRIEEVTSFRTSTGRIFESETCAKLEETGEEIKRIIAEHRLDATDELFEKLCAVSGHLGVLLTLWDELSRTVNIERKEKAEKQKAANNQSSKRK